MEQANPFSIVAFPETAYRQGRRLGVEPCCPIWKANRQGLLWSLGLRQACAADRCAPTQGDLPFCVLRFAGTLGMSDTQVKALLISRKPA